MSISSISSLLNPSSIFNTTQTQQQQTVNSTDPTTVASNSSSTSSSMVKGKGGHHHHRSFGSGEVDSQNVLDNVTQTYGSDAADDITTADGSVDLSKLSQLLGTSSSTTSSTASNPLLNIVA